jgi:glycosyltransferase involved in cell wall biosynthesis
MKIAWVTPFSRRSAIGRVSATVTKELSARNHDIVIIRSEHDRQDDTPPHPSSLPVVWWHDVSPQDLARQNDAIVLNFGDNYEYHAGTLAIAETVLCLGIFHDYYLYNFFNRCLAYNGLGEEAHGREVCLTYGDSVAPLATMAWQNKAAVDQIANVFPMTEWLGRRCGAALVHSQFYLRRLENSCPGPLAVAPLCFEGREVKPLTPRSHSQVTIATIGVINPNKCADAVIRAIGASATLRTNCRYRLVGVISNGERIRLQNLSRELGFDRLDIVGEVDDATLVSELEQADILSCLRNPVLEGASASAIEAMKSGRPIIVSDAGFYADLPDDLVFKIPAAIDVQPLTAVLERLVQDEELRRQTGLRAKDWAMRTFTTEAYVNVLEDLLTRFINATPLLAVGTRVGQQLAELNIAENDPAVERLAEKMRALFGDSGEVRSDRQGPI